MHSNFGFTLPSLRSWDGINGNGQRSSADKGLNGAEESSDKEPRPAFKKTVKARLRRVNEEEEIGSNSERVYLAQCKTDSDFELSVRAMKIKKQKTL